MSGPVSELVEKDMGCEGLLECVHGFKSLDIDCYETVVNAEGAVTIDQVADEVERERSTVYRSIQRLLNSGFVRKEQVNYDDGGYYHVYEPVEPDVAAGEMRELLDEWYEMMEDLLKEYENEYEAKLS